MKRKLLIGLLAFGTVAGFVGGCARMHKMAHYRHGDFRHGRFQDRVAETCAEAAHRVYAEKAAAKAVTH